MGNVQVCPVAQASIILHANGQHDQCRMRGNRREQRSTPSTIDVDGDPQRHVVIAEIV